LPAVHGVAGGAFSAIRTPGKLAVVRIGLVAIHALLEYERLLEISIGMALGTIHAGVFALQRKLRLGVIKALIQRLSGDLFPSACVVAGLAGLPGEASTVGVLVAVRALVERNPRILRLAIRFVGVALRALHLGVQPRQWVARLRVIELGNADLLPVFEIVALLTGRTKAALMGVLVTTAACGGETEIGPVQVLDLDGWAVGGRDARRIVAFVAGKAGVLAFEHVARFLMIEGLDIPLDQREVLAIVLRVAARALLAGVGRNVVGGVQAFVGGKPCRNLGMTVQTFQSRLPAKLVAAGTSCGTVEGLVRPR
jgi:hypothetical protein